jgi:hypothetical protein
MAEIKVVADKGKDTDKDKDDETQDHAFLGREFLTWLLWRADRGEASFASDEGDFTLAFGGRTRLLGVGADVTDAVLKGRSPAHGVEVRAGLGAGRTLREAELRLTRGDREFRFTIIAETLDLKGVKLPARLDDDGDAETDRLNERLLLLDELEKAISVAYLQFVKDRTRPVWDRSVVPALRSWVVDGLTIEGEAR